jgi:hypothetical protein
VLVGWRGLDDVNHANDQVYSDNFLKGDEVLAATASRPRRPAQPYRASR